MKQLLALLLALTLGFALVGCGTPGETTAPSETTAPAETVPVTTEPETAPAEPTQPQVPKGFVRASDVLEGTGIELSRKDGKFLLTEDGLTIEIEQNSRLVHRNGYVIAVMEWFPLVRDGVLYIREAFYHSFFFKEGTDTVSLFHGGFFFPEEILNAIGDPDGSAFNRKLLVEVILPGSMGIEIPKVDMNRVFQYQPLREYPGVLAQELEALGYEDAASYTYTEYAILTGAQTLKQAGITADLVGDIPYDPDMTLWEYYRLSGEQSTMEYLTMITEEQRLFALEKGLETDDMWHLQRVFDQHNWGDFMKESDDTLRATLVEYYETNLDYLQNQVEAYSGDE